MKFTKEICLSCHLEKKTFHSVCTECAYGLTKEFGSPVNNRPNDEEDPNAYNYYWMASFILKGCMMLKAADSFSPNFMDNRVAVFNPRKLIDHMLKPPAPCDKWLIQVWGADDTGYEKEFDTYAEAIETRSLIIEPVSIRWLIDLGFRHV